MQVLALFALALVFFALDQAWKRHRIRAILGALGRTIVEIRWLPLTGYSWTRAQRDTSVFRVSGTTRDGEHFECRCVASVLGQVSIQDDRRAASSFGSALSAAGAMSRGPARATNAIVGGTLSFHAACAAAALLACVWLGAPYWTAPYGSLQLPDGLYGTGLAALAVLACVLGMWRRHNHFAVFLWMTGAVVAVVVVRIANDMAVDPSTHDLMPFEIAIALFVGGVASALGVGIARVVRLATPHAARSAR